MVTTRSSCRPPASDRIACLPDEVLGEIVRLTLILDEKRTFGRFLAIPLVSKRFHRLATPRLYRSLSLNTKDDIILFARTMKDRPDLTQHVRALGLDAFDLKSCEEVKAEFEASVRACTRVERFWMSAKDWPDEVADAMLDGVMTALLETPKPRFYELSLCAGGALTLAKFPYAHVLRMCEVMPNLRTLHLIGLALHTERGAATPKSSPPVLDELCMTACVLEAPPAIHLFAQLATNVVKLDLRHCHVQEMLDLLHAATQSNPRLEQFIGCHIESPFEDEDEDIVNVIEQELEDIAGPNKELRLFTTTTSNGRHASTIAYACHTTELDFVRAQAPVKLADLVEHLGHKTSAPKVRTLRVFRSSRDTQEDVDALTKLCGDRGITLEVDSYEMAIEAALRHYNSTAQPAELSAEM